MMVVGRVGRIERVGRVGRVERMREEEMRGWDFGRGMRGLGCGPEWW